MTRQRSKDANFSQPKVLERYSSAMPTADEGHCEERADSVHCNHWWDGEKPCCDCGHTGLKE